MLKIEKVQRKITKFITYKLGECALSYPERLKKLNLTPLSVRRDVKIIKFINRIITNRESPEDWIKNFEFKRNSRHGNTIKIRKNRINFCDNNIFDYPIKLYNSFPVY